MRQIQEFSANFCLFKLSRNTISLSRWLVLIIARTVEILTLAFSISSSNIASYSPIIAKHFVKYPDPLLNLSLGCAILSLIKWGGGGWVEVGKPFCRVGCGVGVVFGFWGVIMGGFYFWCIGGVFFEGGCFFFFLFYFGGGFFVGVCVGGGCVVF
jgi:hypothetical protein